MNLNEHLLTHAQEEASELIKACSKANRFGLNHWWDKEKMFNRDAIREEMLDLFAIGALMQHAGIIDEITLNDIQRHVKQKAATKGATMAGLSWQLSQLDRDGWEKLQENYARLQA
jgi:hypothetical protein